MIQDSYQNAIDWLFDQFPSYQQLGAPAYKPGLENTLTLLELLGNPQDMLRVIHVAGTNGKGSTCSYLASFLTNENEKVGLFTSPHIFDFRERIRVNGAMISKQEVLDFCNEVQSIKLAIQPSFFEITLAMALVHFARQQCTWVVLETGMGGRLDATNVVLPKISVITNIGLDHMQFLGNTMEAIAKEKAGIIKPFVPVVIGKRQPKTLAIFQKISSEIDAPLHIAEEQTKLQQLLEKADIPKYQKENALSALSTMQVLGMEVSQQKVLDMLTFVVKHTGIFGRLTKVNENPTVYLDVSHNAEGISSTLENLLPEGNLHVVYGCSQDKDANYILSLFPENCMLYLSSFSNNRSRTQRELAQIEQNDQRVRGLFSDVNEAIITVMETISEKDILLVTGSFFLIADIKEDVCNFSV